jgi:hypothetical protein
MQQLDGRSQVRYFNLYCFHTDDELVAEHHAISAICDGTAELLAAVNATLNYLLHALATPAAPSGGVRTWAFRRLRFICCHSSLARSQPTQVDQ